MEEMNAYEKSEFKRLVRRSCKVLNQFPTKPISLDNKTNLHPPVTTDQRQDEFMKMDLEVHQVVENTIDGRKSAQTYWDLKLLKSVVSKKLKKEFGRKLHYKVTGKNAECADFIYVDVRFDDKTEHRHIFRLNPFGFVDNGQVYNDVSPMYLDSKNTANWSWKGQKNAIKEYYANMQDKSWKE